MKIGHNNQSLAVTLTEDERRILGGERIKMRIDPTQKERWMVLEGGHDGMAVYNHSDASHPYRVEMQAELPVFGTEAVKSSTNGHGILFGSRPHMNIPLKAMAKQPRVPKAQVASLAGMPGLEEAKQAVLMVNNFKKTYGDQVSISIEDGILRMRMMLEF